MSGRRILKLADDLPKVALALSLHAPNQELREKLVPSGKAFQLDRLMAALDIYLEKARPAPSSCLASDRASVLVCKDVFCLVRRNGDDLPIY